VSNVWHRLSAFLFVLSWTCSNISAWYPLWRWPLQCTPNHRKPKFHTTLKCLHSFLYVISVKLLGHYALDILVQRFLFGYPYTFLLVRLGPLAGYLWESTWSYDSKKHLQGSLDEISARRKAATYTGEHKKKSRNYIHAWSRFETTIPVLERAKTFPALKRSSIVKLYWIICILIASFFSF
jgi:hypothetical protein